MSEESEEIIGMYEVLEALEDLIEHAHPDKREALAAAIDGYHECFPEDFHWATGASSPVLASSINRNQRFVSRQRKNQVADHPTGRQKARRECLGRRQGAPAAREAWLYPPLRLALHRA
jgi:hypothetical protein